jgi:hypothetical protein
MPRLEGDVFFFGTAIAISLSDNGATRAKPSNLREAGLIEEASPQG